MFLTQVKIFTPPPHLSTTCCWWSVILYVSSSKLRWRRYCNDSNIFIMQFNITRGGCLSPRRDLSYSTVVVECTENVLSIHLLHTYLHSIYYTVYTVYLCIHIYDLYIILLLLPIIISAAIHLHSVLIYIYLYIITCRRGRACHLLRLL